jgi:hypothetical protein
MKPLIVLALLLSFAPACTPPSHIVTAPGKIAFTAVQVELRVNEVQNAAIAANKSGGLDDAQTKVIVTYTVAADKVLQTTPAGWQAVVKQLWQEAAPKITTTNPTIQLAITALTGILGAL